MGKVIGLGGLFLKSPDPDALRAWYARVLGLAFDDWGGLVFLPQDAANHPGAGTVFSPFAQSSEYFAPSTKEFMFNLMVDDLESVLARCAAEGWSRSRPSPPRRTACSRTSWTPKAARSNCGSPSRWRDPGASAQAMVA